MFAVIFEVQPKPEQWDAYLNIARSLRPALEAIDGFIDNERFGSRRTTGKLLSLSLWRDEKAVIRWRTLADHHRAQEAGRNAVFADYHLRVGEVMADSALTPGARRSEQRRDETETGAAKAVTISQVAPSSGAPPPGDLADILGLGTASPAPLDHEVFESITAPGKVLLLASWPDAAAAAAWRPKTPGAGALRHLCVRIIRDYGLADRREAPQYYPPRTPSVSP